MTKMRLKKVRNCDGSCCKESPRWPNVDGVCKYQAVNGDCMIMSGDAELDDERSPCMPKKDPQAVFQETCLEWPHNSKPERPTNNSCWQWIEDGN